MRRVGLPFACVLLAVSACNALTGVSDLVPCDSCDREDSSSPPAISADASVDGVVADGTVDSMQDSSTTGDAADAKADDDAADTGVDASIGCNGAIACERVVFVTSLIYPGTLGDVAGADAKCQARADASSIARIRGRTFVAWVSTLFSSASGRLTHGTLPYVRSDGLTVATSWSELVDGAINNGIGTDELGGNQNGENVWTGTAAVGAMFSGAACQSWSSSSAGFSGDVGKAGNTGNAWTSNGASGCQSANHLYCFEK